ncbi:MAG: MFS transporter [Armatimonadetes bacterium]|nr:MFS transporter [Armatimonadota bacterium]
MVRRKAGSGTASIACRWRATLRGHHLGRGTLTVETTKYNPSRLFVASCIALATTAMVFSIRGDILKTLGLEFDLDHTQQGWINTAAFWGFAGAMIVGGPLCDTLGMGLLLRLACVGHILGVVLTIVSPGYGFPMLLTATLVIGLANGTVEAVINPLCATLHPKEKTHRLNVLHAWWPAGLIIGGLLTFGLSRAFGLGAPQVGPAIVSLSWKVKMGFIILAAVLYGVLLMGQKFPATERVASGVSTAGMFREVLCPGFLLLICCMCLVAITSVGPDQWMPSVMTDTLGMDGILFLVYTSGLMFVLRFFAGPLSRWLSPFGLLWLCAAFAAAGLFWLSHAFTLSAAVAAATVFGIGKTYFWPTMLGVTSERYPRGGALAMALMGSVGTMAAGIAFPAMGSVYDEYTKRNLPAHVARRVVDEAGHYRPEIAETLTNQADKEAVKEALKHGAAMAYRSMVVLPGVLLVLFGAMFFYFRSLGGYRPIEIGARCGAETRAGPG